MYDLFSKKGTKIFYFFGKVINEVTSHKHLGIHLNFRLNWLDHVDYINTKCMRRLYFFKRLYFINVSTICHHHILLGI
jgi:hypothetical protein